MELDTVKEVLNMNKANEETAVGYESLNEDSDDMVQDVMQETAMAKAEREKTWDNGKRDGEVEGVEEERPAFGSLSSLNGIVNEGDTQIKTEEFNQEYDEKQEKKKQKEINKLKRDMRSKLKQLDNAEDKSWTLNNVQIVLRDGKPYKYLVSMSCMELAEWYISKKLIYDFGVQRGSSINKKGEEVPILFLKHSRNIQTAILDGSIHGGNLSFNFPTDNDAELFYDDENMTLSGDGPLTINDGFHRIYASYLWYKEFVKQNSTCKSPETFYFPCNIEHISRQASCDLFKEYAVMGKSISKNRISVHDVFSKDYEVAQRIIKESQLRGRVEMISNSIKKSSSNIFTYGTILNGIAEMKIATKSEEKPVGDFLIEFLDNLIELFPLQMGNVDQETRSIEKQKSFVLEKMFQNSYFYLANQLRGREDWKNRLSKLAQNNFLSKSNPKFSFCLREGDKIINSSKIQKDINSLVVDYVMSN